MVKIFSILIFLLAGSAASTQQFRGGLLLGACGTQVDGDTFSGYDKSGVVAGALVQYPLSDRVNLQAEIKYFPKGSRAKASKELGGYAFYEMKLHYIEMPYFLNYRFKLTINKKEMKFSAEGGLGFAYLLKSKEYDMGYERMYGKPFNKYEISGMYGLNYLINDHIGLNFRYHYSLLTIRRFTDNYNPTPGRILFNKGQYNNILSFSVYLVL